MHHGKLMQEPGMVTCIMSKPGSLQCLCAGLHVNALYDGHLQNDECMVFTELETAYHVNK